MRPPLPLVLGTLLAAAVPTAVLPASDPRATTPPPVPGPLLDVRNGHAMAYDSDRERVLLFGGADERQVLGDLWEWDGRRWSLLASEGPPPRTFAALAYDRARHRLVLFGGNRVLFGKGGDEETCLGDLWEWYDAAWHEVHATGPPARAEAAMTYDRAHRRTLLFGGYRGSGASRERLGDTWAFDGVSWNRVAGPGPQARNGAAMAFDARRGRVVLFGGSGGPREDTWEWDGVAWRRVDAPTPGRYNSAMAYDARLHAILRFGGWDGKDRVAETWRYDGRRWTPVPGSGPGPRNHAAMAYDDKRRVMVLFGGHDGARVFGDTWERSEQWTCRLNQPALPRVDNGH